MQEMLASGYKKIFFTGLFIYAIAAWFSFGYHYPDEHFQVLEFCNYKLGKIEASQLPWEFKAQMRPGLQPAITFIIIQGLKFFHINNPFLYAFVLRLIIAFLGWLVICKLILLLLKNFTTEKGKFFFVFVSFFVWFTPYINVRFASENASAIALLGAIYFLLKEKKTIHFFIAGLLLGFSFYFRYQIAFAIIGVGLWLLFQKEKFKNVLFICIAFLIVAAICTLIDYWMYEQWVCTPYNYYFFNITKGIAAANGVEPWYFYFQWFILIGFIPVSIFLFLFFFTGIATKPKNILAFAAIPFLLAHIVLDHKEMRFIFPMIFPFTFFVALGFEKLQPYLNNIFLKIIWHITLFINLGLLVFRCFVPAQEAVDCYKYLYDNYNKKPVTIICVGVSLYKLSGLDVSFYKADSIKEVDVSTLDEAKNHITKNSIKSALMLNEEISFSGRIENYSLKRIYCTYPDWVLKFNFNNWEQKTRVWSLWELNKN